VWYCSLLFIDFFKFMSKKKGLHFHIISLFPKMIDSYIKDSIVGRAIKAKKIKVDIYNPRDFSTDKHKRVDHKPYGGGPGMVMQAEPVLKAVAKAIGRKKKVKIIIFSPSGRKFTNTYARELVEKNNHIILIAGRYEGIDSRVKKILKAEEVSIGDYILTGGELPALVVVDATARQIPGVLGNLESNEDERVASSEFYTRPEVLEYKGKKYKVPKILLSGHHKDIDEWRKRKSKKDFLKS